MPNRQTHTTAAIFALITILLMLPACAARTLRGTVTAGQVPAVLVLNPDEPRLDRPGLAGAVIELALDPSSMSPRPLGTFTADGQGRFAAALDHPGIGVLDFELGILCRAGGHRSVYQTMALPRSDRRLLVVMSPGTETTKKPEGLLDEARRIGGHGTPYR